MQRIGTCVLAASLFALVQACHQVDFGRSLGASCEHGWSCREPYVCDYGRCRAECSTETDCDKGTCLVASGAADDAGIKGVCTTPAENDCAERPCPESLACGIDGICRNACSASDSCPGHLTCVEGACFEERPELPDAGMDARTMMDSGGSEPGPADAGADAVADTGVKPPPDAGMDASMDAGIDAGMDAGMDAGVDSGAADGILFFVSAATHDGNLGGRSGADAICMSERPVGLSSCGVVHAVLCAGGADDVRSMPASYGYNPSLPLSWYNRSTSLETPFAGSWSEFVGGTISSSPSAGLGITASENYWTGCNQDGSALSFDCSVWTSNTDWPTGGCTGGTSTNGDPTETTCGHYLRSELINPGAVCQASAPYCDPGNLQESGRCGVLEPVLCACQRASKAAEKWVVWMDVSGEYRVYVTDRDCMNPVQLCTGCRDPRISPSGRKVVVRSTVGDPSPLSVIDLPVSGPPGAPQPVGVSGSSFYWADDDRLYYYAFAGCGGSVAPLRLHDFAAPSDASVLTGLNNGIMGAVSLSAGFIATCQQVPDGCWSPNMRVRIYPIGSSTPVEPTWSADGLMDIVGGLLPDESGFVSQVMKGGSGYSPPSDLYVVGWDGTRSLIYADLDASVANAANAYPCVGTSRVTASREFYCAGSGGAWRLTLDGTPPVAVACAIDGGTPYNIDVWQPPPDGHLLWARRAGSADSGNEETASALAVLSDGTTYVAGRIAGTATFGPGEPNQTILVPQGTDIFLAKYAPNGDLMWARKAGGTGTDTAAGIAATNTGDVVVVGNFGGYSGGLSATFGQGEANETTLTSAGGTWDGFVARYASDGSLAWAKRLGGPGSDGDITSGVGVASNGDIIIGGVYSNGAVFGPGEANETTLSSSGVRDVFVARLDGGTGQLQWVKHAGGPNQEQLGNLRVLGGDSFVAYGTFNTTATFGTGEAGETILSAAGGDDVFVARFNSDGTLAWARRAGGTGKEYVAGIDLAPDGALYAAGYFQGTATFDPGGPNQTMLTATGADDMFIMHVTANGALLSAIKAGITADATWPGGVHATADGGVVLAAAFTGTTTFGSGEPNETTLMSAGGSDAFVARYRADGKLVWARRVGGSGADAALGVGAAADGSLRVVGLFSTSATFGPGEAGESVLSSGGAQDIFVAAFAP